MTTLSPAGRLAVGGLAWLALFALLFSIGSALDFWPGPPHGGFAGTDLVAGLAFGLALLLFLLRRPGR